MKKFLLVTFLAIMTSCTSLPEVKQGTIEDKVDSTGTVVKVLTNYRDEISKTYGNEKTIIYNGSVRNGKFTGTRQTEVIKERKRKISLEETVKNDKVLEKKYDEYKEKNKDDNEVIITGTEKNGIFTGTKKTKEFYDLMLISKEIKNNRVIGETKSFTKEYWDINLFSPNVLLATANLDWYKEKKVGNIKEIEAQTIYFDLTEEFIKKAELGSYLKNSMEDIKEKGYTEDFLTAYRALGIYSFINLDEKGHLKPVEKIKAKYNMNTNTFITFEYYFKDKKINTSKMSNAKKKEIYNKLRSEQMKTVENVYNIIEQLVIKDNIRQAEARAAMESFLNGLQGAVNAYEAMEAQNEYNKLQQQRLENAQDNLRKLQMMNEERRIMNSSSYPTNADKHKAVVETWNNYSK